MYGSLWRFTQCHSLIIPINLVPHLTAVIYDVMRVIPSATVSVPCGTRRASLRVGQTAHRAYKESSKTWRREGDANIPPDAIIILPHWGHLGVNIFTLTFFWGNFHSKMFSSHPKFAYPFCQLWMKSRLITMATLRSPGLKVKLLVAYIRQIRRSTQRSV